METVVRADVKCPKCKTYRFPNDFLNEKNRVLKTCQVCRNIGKKSREKNTVTFLYFCRFLFAC